MSRCCAFDIKSGQQAGSFERGLNEGSGNKSDATPTCLALSFCVSILAVSEEPHGRSCSDMSKSSSSSGAGRINFGCCCPVASSAGVSSRGLSACATEKNALTLLILLLIALKMLALFVFARHSYKCIHFANLVNSQNTNFGGNNFYELPMQNK